jgi:hypothetical protein
MSKAAFASNKNLVSRRNQDGTALIMKMDESNKFFKINGLLALIWGELETPKTEAQLINHFSDGNPNLTETLKIEVPKFIKTLSDKGLIAPADSLSTATFTAAAMDESNSFIGDFKEFNLAQLETEILNDSIYLDVFAGSDFQLKNDIAPLKNSLEKVLSLNGISYRWNETTAPQMDKGQQCGVIAQEVAAVMPELVRKDFEKGFLAVNYSKMNAYLVEAIKELHTHMNQQEARIKDLENALQARIQ